MQNIGIAVTGFEELAAAMNRLAAAIEAQKAWVVPTESDPTSQEQEAEAEQQAEKAPEGKATSTVSLEDVRKKFVDLARSGKRDELKALLGAYKVDNVSSLPEEVLDEVYTRLEAI